MLRLKFSYCPWNGPKCFRTVLQFYKHKHIPYAIHFYEDSRLILIKMSKCARDKTILIGNDDIREMANLADVTLSVHPQEYAAISTFFSTQRDRWLFPLNVLPAEAFLLNLGRQAIFCDILGLFLAWPAGWFPVVLTGSSTFLYSRPREVMLGFQ